ncbi:MAG: agmatine deiminase family protein [Bacteroidia bacterium]|nr:agmatine deiminase family protein [Bacteroidia bacterium]
MKSHKLCILICLAVVSFSYINSCKAYFESPTAIAIYHLSDIPDTINLTHSGGANNYNHYLKNFTETSPPPQPVRQPAEFEPMQGVLIRYPFGISLGLIAEMASGAEVVTIVGDSTELATVTDLYTTNGVDTSHCSFLIVANTECFYTRDFGPWYIFTGENIEGITDFKYNRPARPISDGVPIELGASDSVPVYGMNLTHTGGNYMTDGMGVAVSTDLVLTENPGLSEQEVKQKVHDYLGINTYYLPPDIYSTGIMHIDCWAKFLSPDKIMIRQVPETHPQYSEIEARVAYFSSKISSYGTPYKIFRVYTPDDEAYSNVLILNNKVLVPLFSTAWDDSALVSWQDAMPGYTVTGYTGSWYSDDALHCRTMGITDRNMLYIRHIPLHDTEASGTLIPLGCRIHPYSGHGLIADSLLVYYRTNGGNWNILHLQQAATDSFYTVIPGMTDGTIVEYYIHAADSAGKSENHPYIGKANPHKFKVGIDNLPPEIVHTPLPSQSPAGITYNFSAWTWDLNGVQSVYLEYIIGDIMSDPIEMTLGSDDTYQLTLTPSVITGDTIRYRIRATDNSNQHNTGYFPASDFIKIAIVPTVPVLVVDPVNTSGQVISNYITELGINNDFSTSLSGFNIYNYSSVFLCLGVYSNNHVLNTSETTMLADYINSGGKIYTEGGDCWYFDNSHLTLDPLFHIDPVADNNDITTSINGAGGTFTEDMIYDYTGDNNYMDVIANQGDADMIFTTATTVGRGVAYFHKTVGLCFEIKGLVDAAFPSTQKELVKRILEYFYIWPAGITENTTNHARMNVMPNPSKERVTVDYVLPENGSTRLDILDIYGRVIRVFDEGNQNAGDHEQSWNHRDDTGALVPPGIYFARVSLEGKLIACGKIVIL